MPSLHETAYPRLKNSPSNKELTELYTPTAEELALSAQVARSTGAKIFFLVLLKTSLGTLNKSEGFNNFAQWVSFGGHGVIAENDRDEQRKLIKYNHLVANCLIFHNMFAMT